MLALSFLYKSRVNTLLLSRFPVIIVLNTSYTHLNVLVGTPNASNACRSVLYDMCHLSLATAAATPSRPAAFALGMPKTAASSRRSRHRSDDRRVGV